METSRILFWIPRQHIWNVASAKSVGRHVAPQHQPTRARPPARLQFNSEWSIERCSKSGADVCQCAALACCTFLASLRHISFCRSGGPSGPPRTTEARPCDQHRLALTPGTRLGVYEVTAQIGEGGWGGCADGTTRVRRLGCDRRLSARAVRRVVPVHRRLAARVPDHRSYWALLS